MLPSRDPSLAAGGASALDRAGLAAVDSVSSDLNAALFAGAAIGHQHGAAPRALTISASLPAGVSAASSSLTAPITIRILTISRTPVPGGGAGAGSRADTLPNLLREASAVAILLWARQGAKRACGRKFGFASRKQGPILFA